MRATALLTIFVVVLLQGSVLPLVRVAGVMPDAALVLVSSTALLLGGVRAAPIAAGVGLLLDLLGGTPVGLSSAALLVAVLLIGWWRHTIFYQGIAIHVAAAVVATFAYDAALLVGMQSLHDLVNWPLALLHIVAPSAVLNGALALPIGYLGGELARRLGYVDTPVRLRGEGVIGSAR